MKRRCDILANGQFWRERSLSEVRQGFIFRLYEQNGDQVVDEDGHWRWRALSDAVDVGDGEWEVDAEAVPETEVEAATRSGEGFFPRTSHRGLSVRGLSRW